MLRGPQTSLAIVGALQWKRESAPLLERIIPQLHEDFSRQGLTSGTLTSHIPISTFAEFVHHYVREPRVLKDPYLVIP